jgi:putative hydrolase of the HAD superfamily
MIRAVFFDLDDTLVDSANPWRAGLAAAVADLCEQRPGLSSDDVYAAWHAANWALVKRLDAGDVRMATVRERRWLDTLLALGLDDPALAAALDARLVETYIGGLRLFDDVGTLPEDLRARFHVGIITNGADDDALDSQRTKAARTGLLARADSFLASDAAGARKPDPHIFHLALERAGVAPTEALYVGDNIINDIAGANRAGMISVLIWRTPEPRPVVVGDERPAQVVETLRKLPALLASL